MSLINVSNLTFSYEGSYDNIFENVSFQIDTDWKLGFIGRNGKGKTTFLNLLLGKYTYSGNISAVVNFEYFPYDIVDKTMNTLEVIDSIYSEYQHWELIRELSLLEVDEDVLYRPFETLSNGEQTKILLSILFLKENSFLLIDEPTTHLDLGARNIVSNYLKNKKGFILVSHDRTFLNRCVDHILSINKTSIEIQRGDFSSWITNKERRDSFEFSENEKLQKEIKRLSSSAQRTSNWSDMVEKTKYTPNNAEAKPDRGYIGHKAAKMMKRSKNIETRKQDAVKKKSELLHDIENVHTLKIQQQAYYSDHIITLDHLSIFYGDKIACKDISFNIMRGDRIALIGNNGSGKSSIIKLINGEAMRFEGNYQKGSNLRISYIPQDTSFLSGNLSDYAMQNNIAESLFKTILYKLDFSRTQFEKDMSSFSSGQKKKVLIAKSLCENAHLLLWDEPLNFIDIISRIQIETLLLQYKPTILFVEHDSAFCDKIATKKIVLSRQ